MKHRNPLAVVGLSIITFGIYDLYWLSVTRKELNSKTSHKVPTLWLLFSPVFAGIVIGIIAIGLSAHSTSSTTTSPGPNIFALILMVLDIFAAIVISLLWFFKFSKSINEYTSGKLSTATTFLILWLLHLIGVALVQDTFNDMLSGSPAPAMAPQQPMPTPAQGQPMAQVPFQPNSFAPGESPAPAMAPQQPMPTPAQGKPMAQVPFQPNSFAPGESPVAQPYSPTPPYSVQPEQQPTVNQTFPPDTPVVG